MYHNGFPALQSNFVLLGPSEMVIPDLTDICPVEQQINTAALNPPEHKQHYKAFHKWLTAQVPDECITYSTAHMQLHTHTCACTGLPAHVCKLVTRYM